MPDPRPTCPACGRARLEHDKFEDMYSCPACYLFFEPDEVGKDEDPDAGFLKMDGKD